MGYTWFGWERWLSHGGVWLENFNIGEYLQHEKQDKAFQDLGLGQRKGDLGVHWYRVQN